MSNDGAERCANEHHCSLSKKGSARARGQDRYRCRATHATPTQEDLLNSETARRRQLSEARRTPPTPPQEALHRRAPPKVHAAADKEPPRSNNQCLLPNQVPRAMLPRKASVARTARRRRAHMKRRFWSNDGAPSCSTLSRFSSRNKLNSSRSGLNSPPRSTSTPRQVPNLFRQGELPRRRLAFLFLLLTVRSRTVPVLPARCCSLLRPRMLRISRTSSWDLAVMFASSIRLSLRD